MLAKSADEIRPGRPPGATAVNTLQRNDFWRLVLGLAHSPWLALTLAWLALAAGAGLSGHLSRHPVRDFGRWRQRWATGGLDGG